MLIIDKIKLEESIDSEDKINVLLHQMLLFQNEICKKKLSPYNAFPNPTKYKKDP